MLVGCASAPKPPVAMRVRREPPTPVASDLPRPPADLDQLLVQYYPRRGLVLRENGAARVSFTVEPSGMVTTSGVVSASRPEYGAACRRMLEGTAWTPARRAGTAVAFSSVFDCRFEHAGADATRGFASPALAVRPVRPRGMGRANVR